MWGKFRIRYYDIPLRPAEQAGEMNAPEVAVDLEPAPAAAAAAVPVPRRRRLQNGLTEEEVDNVICCQRNFIVILLIILVGFFFMSSSSLHVKNKDHGCSGKQKYADFLQSQTIRWLSAHSFLDHPVQIGCKPKSLHPNEPHLTSKLCLGGIGHPEFYKEVIGLLEVNDCDPTSPLQRWVMDWPNGLLSNYPPTTTNIINNIHLGNQSNPSKEQNSSTVSAFSNFRGCLTRASCLDPDAADDCSLPQNRSFQDTGFLKFTSCSNPKAGAFDIAVAESHTVDFHHHNRYLKQQQHQNNSENGKVEKAELLQESELKQHVYFTIRSRTRPNLCLSHEHALIMFTECQHKENGEVSDLQLFYLSGDIVDYSIH